MTKAIAEINEKTSIPLFTAIGVMIFLIPTIVYVTNVAAESSRSAKDIEAQKEINKYQEKVNLRTYKSLVRIETKLGTLPKEKEDE